MTELEIQAAIRFREPLPAFYRQLEGLHRELGTARLAFGLGVERETVMGWRKGRLFPSRMAVALVRWMSKTSPRARRKALQIEKFRHYQPRGRRGVKLSQVMAAQPDDYTPGGAIFDFWDGSGI